MPSIYDDNHRQLQDRFDSRALADTLEFATVNPLIDDAAKKFIEERAFFFLSTVNASGHPTVSHKGGAPGFVRVLDSTTLVFPSYDGNGMFLSMGNIAGDGRIGLLFIDFNTPHRVRAHANAVLVHEGALLNSYPGADLVVVASITESFINCPRYITKQASAEPAPHVPDVNGDAPLAEWKKIDLLQDVLPKRFQNLADNAGGTITIDEYNEKVLRGET
ncbi:MAG: pyridoxamine 5'-phosphate oxidase family protein [Actinobacteria bacterium]|nr:pyridoxamine 5'-phosphate oxidase family protein [Actinomycetota bacterium]MBV9255362.1 pyridoxamine 5'-phosphate oxidase family protein [Actinomycetota bacterium]